MGIATFSPAIKATSVRDNLSRILVAIDDSDKFLLAIDTDGKFEWLELSEVIVDLRYDPKTGIWTDPTEEHESD